ncbi:hypothetical protein D3C85_1022460 [compost metagenome]
MRLQHRHALVTIDLTTQGCGRITNAIQQRGGVTRRCTCQVGVVELQGHVWPVTDFATQRGAVNVGLEAQAIQANVFGIVDEIARSAQRRDRVGGIERHGRTQRAQVRAAAVIVHYVGTKFGVVKLRHEPAQGQAILAAVTGLVVFYPRGVGIVGVVVETGGVGRVVGQPRSEVKPCADLTIVAPFGQRVGTEEGAAIVNDRAFPFQLIEGFRTEILGDVLRHVEHVDRNQTFLDLGTGTTQCGHIDRVDRVDAVTDEGALAPAHHLLAQAHVARQLADVVAVIDKGIEEFGTRSLGHVIATTVVDVIKRPVFVLQFKVVPVLATNEDAAVAILQFQVMDTLEDLREGFALLEVQAIVVRQPGRRIAARTLRVKRGNEIRIPPAQRPTGAHRK